MRESKSQSGPQKSRALAAHSMRPVLRSASLVAQDALEFKTRQEGREVGIGFDSVPELGIGVERLAEQDGNAVQVRTVAHLQLSQSGALARAEGLSTGREMLT